MMFAALEWTVALRKRRALLLNIIVPGALIAALPAGNAPRVHVAVVCTILFAFFGTFGSAIPLVHDAATAKLGMLLQAGAAPRSLFPQRVFAAAAIDLLHLLPAVAVLSIAYRSATVLPFLLCLAATLVAANAIGVWIAALTRSIGEAALVSSVCALLLLHLGGVFRTPVPNTWSDTIAPLSPFRPLFHATRAALQITNAPIGWDFVFPAMIIAAVATASVLFGGSLIAHMLRDRR